MRLTLEPVYSTMCLIVTIHIQYEDGIINIQKALKQVATEFYGELGAWAYERFEHHRTAYFSNTLEPPMIRFELIPHGVAIGLCGTSPTGKSIITLAPYLLSDTYHVEDTKLDDVAIGRVNLVDDILLHEMMHQSVSDTCRKLGQPHPKESHNNEHWFAECNRIAPLLGFTDYKAGPYKTRRIPKADGGGTFKATLDGCVEYKEIYGFPHHTYIRLGANRYVGSAFDFEKDFTL